MGEKKRRTRGQLIPLEDVPREKCRTWGIRVTLKERGPKGRRREHYETLNNATLRKAERRRDALLALIDAGLFRKPAPITVSKLADEFVEQKRREGKRPATVYAYGDAAKNYLKPFIGHLPLKELTPLAVRDFYNRLQDRGLSSATIEQARKVLNLALKAAVLWGRLASNPAAGIPAPKGSEGRVGHSLTVDEARALIEVSLADPEDLIVPFALLTGLRPEEFLGLPRSNVEFVGGRGVARVRQVAVRLRGGGWAFLPPKTKKGVRDVPFPGWLHRELQRLDTLVEVRRRATGEGWTDYGLVFPSRTGEPQTSGALRKGRFRQLLKRAGLPDHFNLYSLRYTFATLQTMAGERDRVISDLMGHVRTDFTKDVYVRVLPVQREQASDSLERLLFGEVRATLTQSMTERVM